MCFSAPAAFGLLLQPAFAPVICYPVGPQMAGIVKPGAGKPGAEEDAPQEHRIRITLTSKNVKNLEKGASSSCAWPLSAHPLQPSCTRS